MPKKRNPVERVPRREQVEVGASAEEEQSARRVSGTKTAVAEGAATAISAAPRWFRVALLGLFLSSLAIYWQTGTHDFINLDDNEYIYLNKNVKGGLTVAGVQWAITSVGHFYWQPLTWISHMVDCQLYGLRAGGHHRTSMLLHGLNCALLAWAMFVLTGKPGRSVFAAALYGVHPLRVESVAWAAERKDVLSGLFWILTLGLYGWYAKAPSRKRYWCVFAGAVLAATSKPTTVTLPCVLLLLDYWPLGRMRSVAMFRERLREKLPFFGIAVVLSILTWVGQREAGATVSLTSMPVYYRAYNGVLSYAAYLRRSFWPGELSIFYPMHKIDSTDVWMAAGALLVITGIALWLARRFPYGIVGWLYFVGALVPMIGLAQTGAQALADRFTYIPATGLFVAFVWAVTDAAERFAVPRAALVAAGCLACVPLAVQSYRYTSFWKDSFTLFEHSIAVTEDNDFLHFNLTNMYINEGKLAQAAAHIEQGVRIEPKLPEARILAAQVYSKMGNAPKAVEHLQVLRQLRPMDLGVQMELGSALWRMGRKDEARAELDAVLRQAPNDIEARSLRLMMQ